VSRYASIPNPILRNHLTIWRHHSHGTTCKQKNGTEEVTIFTSFLYLDYHLIIKDTILTGIQSCTEPVTKYQTIRAIFMCLWCKWKPLSNWSWLMFKSKLCQIIYVSQGDHVPGRPHLITTLLSPTSKELQYQ